MTDARFTLTIGALSNEAALKLATSIEDDFRHDPLAVSINETNELLGHWEIVAYFSSADECRALAAVYAADKVRVAEVPDLNWVKQSLQGLAPISAGRFYIHGSHDRGKRRAGGISIEIDAATAFGTGHHGTTIGCLRALDRILKFTKPNAVFDLGCGTGVLAIAAARATHASILATDIDAEAVRVAVNNARLNKSGQDVKACPAAGLHHRQIRAHAGFDLVFANILARPLASLAPALSLKVRAGGYLILSGITRDQVRWIKSCYRNRGMIVTATTHVDNWSTLVMQRAAKKRCPNH